jgi:hypothetical protein
VNTTTRSILVTAALALALPATASASTVEVTASAGPSASEYIEYRTTKGENNRVRVLFAKNSVVIVDKGTKRITPKRGAGFGACRATSRQRVVCPDFPLFAFLRDGNDRLSVAPGDRGEAPTSTNPVAYAESYEDTEGAVTETLLVDAGSGNDFISGSKFNDTIFPRSGLDRVEGRGGPDDIGLQPDGVTDRIIGGGGIDDVSYSIDQPLLIDLAARTGGPPGDPDTLAYIERVHGGSADDQIRGSANSEALYGEGGNDLIDGRAGNDLVVGDAPLSGGERFPNTLIGGEGDDIADTRAEPVTPTSTVDCGPGNDRHMGGVDTRLDPNCESVLLRTPFGSLTEPASEAVSYNDPMRATPVAKTPDSVTFEAVCPPEPRGGEAPCTGTIVVEKPPDAPSSAPTEQYGSANFSLTSGQRANVTVPLNAAGQAAVAGNGPVAVRVNLEFVSAGTPVGRAHLGFQADL